MQFVIPYHHQTSTTSLLVAQKFEKRHDDVLKAIKNLECSSEFRARNFADSSYQSAQNKVMPMYIITRDGFTFLVMGFTGSMASKFKEEYINEFNRMEKLLRNSTPALIPTYQARILSEPTKDLPHSHWSIFDQSHHIMLSIEKYIGSVNKYDLVDGSIGKRWCSYRKGKYWAMESETFTYHHEDNRGDVECKCYQMDELPFFKDWLINKYKAQYLKEYLLNKYKSEKNYVMLNKVNQFFPKLLGGSAN